MDLWLHQITVKGSARRKEIMGGNKDDSREKQAKQTTSKDHQPRENHYHFEIGLIKKENDGKKSQSHCHPEAKDYKNSMTLLQCHAN